MLQTMGLTVGLDLISKAFRVPNGTDFDHRKAAILGQQWIVNAVRGNTTSAALVRSETYVCTW